MHSTTENSLDFKASFSPEGGLAYHHPGYQSLGDQSWWCDGCLNECRTLPDLQGIEQGDGEHWYDFSHWLTGLIVKGTGAVLTALFALVVFVMGRSEWDESAQNNNYEQRKWKLERDLNWLLLRQERLAAGIQQKEVQIVRAYFEGGRPAPDDIRDEIRRMQRELQDTIDQIKQLEVKIIANDVLREAQNAQARFVTAQMSDHGGH